MRLCHVVITLIVIGTFGITGCHSVSGNVIPQSGPSMESVYDSMGVADSAQQAGLTNAVHEKNASEVSTKTTAEDNLGDIRKQAAFNTPLSSSATSSIHNNAATFHKLPNPELKLYIYPHLAGTDEIPIPGYETAFNVYDKTYYVLPSEMPH